MRVPSFQPNVRLLQSAGIFLSGIIIGGALFMAMYQHNFNEMYLAKINLKDQYDVLLEETNNLKIYKNNQTIVKYVKVHLEQTNGKINSQKVLDPITVKEIERRTKQEMIFLIGHSIEDIPEFVQKTRGLMNSKLYSQINSKNYIVNITTVLVINGGIEIWIAAEEFIHKGN